MPVVQCLHSTKRAILCETALPLLVPLLDSENGTNIAGSEMSDSGLIAYADRSLITKTYTIDARQAIILDPATVGMEGLVLTRQS